MEELASSSALSTITEIYLMVLSPIFERPTHTHDFSVDATLP
jgi:hypothetical protein